jgi:hypothetical protein
MTGKQRSPAMPEGMLPVTLAAVERLRPFLPTGRVRLTLNHGPDAPMPGEECTGRIVCFAVRADGADGDTRRRVVDLVFQEDTAPDGLRTTIPVDHIRDAEPPPPLS